MSVISYNKNGITKVLLTSNGTALTFDDLVEQINETTGKNDTTLSAAVDRLIDGYGQGGGSGPGLISDVVPVFHTTVTLDENFTDTSSSGSFPMTAEQKNAVLEFFQTHLTGSSKSYQIIVSAQADVVPADKRLFRCDRNGIVTGKANTIGTNIGNGVFVMYSGTSGTKSMASSWNPSLYGIGINVANDITTCYATMRCNSICTSIGAGTYDLWIIAQDLSKIGGADNQSDEMSPEDALNILTGGEA